jgi:hypothetical protein
MEEVVGVSEVEVTVEGTGIEGWEGGVEGSVDVDGRVGWVLEG